jgi:CSLREA domain-containing protein
LPRLIGLAATIAIAAAAGAVVAPSAGAANQGYIPSCAPGCVLIVDSTADLTDLHPGDGKCKASNGLCTLRAAVQEANALPRHTAILVNPGVYKLTRHGLDDTAALGDLDMHFDGEVVGAGQSRTVVDGDGADRVFDLHRPGERVAHLAVRNGVATDGPGGGIRSSTQDFLEYLFITDNSAVAGDAPDSGFGGGIAASGGTIRYSAIAYNNAADGGGVWYHGAQTSSSSNLLLHNHVTGDGGGMYFAADDTFVTNTTISGNTAGGHGGGLYLAAPGSFGPGGFLAVTIASNSAPTAGAGGIWREPVGETGADSIRGSIVAGNAHGDCGGTGSAASLGSNLDSDGTCGFTGSGDLSSTDPKLGPVADNGGPTMTRALGTGSPAIDAWPCGNNSLDPAVDQRGATRPQGDGCDIGAFEVGNCCPASEPPYVEGSIQDPNKPRTGPCGVILEGTSGPDTLVGTPVRNEIHGGRGNDRIFGLGGADCLFGGLGDDLIRGGNGADVIHGGAGNDTLYGGRGDDAIHGESGNDHIYGGPGDDLLIGGPGNDYIKTGGGYDTVRAGPGNDFIDATGKGLAKVDCGSGDDTVIAKRLEHLYRCEHVRFVG